MHKLTLLILFVVILFTNAQQYSVDDDDDYDDIYDEHIDFSNETQNDLTDNPYKIVVAASYLLISTIGIIANLIVFFVIIAGREIC